MTARATTLPPSDRPRATLDQLERMWGARIERSGSRLVLTLPMSGRSEWRRIGGEWWEECEVEEKSHLTPYLPSANCG